LDVDSYQNVKKWAELIDARPAVQRGRMVNKVSGEPSLQLHERHDAADFDWKNK
jgi:GST-like protein